MLINYKKLPFNPELCEHAKHLRNNMTLSEVLIWKELYRKKFLGLNFDRQKVIGNYIVDFYCPDIGMVVEIDGDSHDFKEKYDTKRDTYLESLGLIVIHLGDLEIKKNISWPLSILYEETKKRMQNLGMTTPET